MRTVLEALCVAHLYVNPENTHLFCMEIDFLGHHISTRGIEADNKKVSRIMNWPQLKSSSEERGFLGLVCYIAAFLLALADHTGILTELTTKEAERSFPLWVPRHQKAFEEIKRIVTSRDCLMTIDFSKMLEYKIFVTTDASDRCSGAILSFGPSWETACPVAFDSMTFKNAELNYPVHKKELLTIIHVLKKWQVNLLGVPFFIYTDHKTLENLNVQKDLSCRQARWMELMSQFDTKIVYIKGEDNTVADALLHLLSSDTPFPSQDMFAKSENSAQHPYHFCEDNNDSMVASIVLPNLCSPWESATCLSTCVPSMRPIGATLEKLPTKPFWNPSDLDIKMMCGVKPYLPHQSAGQISPSVMSCGMLGID